MNIETLEEAISEAQRFLSRAEKLREKLENTNVFFVYDFPVESGSVKRASMDLTRALANMRRR